MNYGRRKKMKELFDELINKKLYKSLKEMVGVDYV